MKKILILTQPLRVNYGGIVQAYALQKVLKEMGCEVVTDNPVYLGKRSLYSAVKDFLARFIFGFLLSDKKYQPLFVRRAQRRKDYEKIACNMSDFVERHIDTIDFFKGKVKPLPQDIENFEIYIAGGDQVWRRKYGDVKRYFFDFLGQSEKKRFSYAASFGLDNIDEYSSKEKEKCRQLLRYFSAIGVREQSGVEIVRKEFGELAVQVADPVMLLEKEDYMSLCEYEPKEEGFLFCYILDKDKNKQEIAQTISRRLAKPIEDILPEKDWKKNHDNLEGCTFAKPCKWLQKFRDADFVVTDSFHGTVLSIVFNKNFICVSNSDRGTSRLDSLLSFFGLQDRLIGSLKDLDGKLLFNLLKTDFERVDKLRREFKEFSLKFLSDNIK